METKFKMKIPFLKNSRAARNSAAAHKMRLGKDPYFDWTVILALFIATAVLCGSFAFALWDMVGGDSGSSSAISETSLSVPALSLNEAGLQKIITLQSDKSSAVSEYEQGYPGPSDPSL